jgi:membrane-associated phospholipid phosphatase
VQELGALHSLVRTSEQTQIAMFWGASAAVIWNGVLQQIVAARFSSLSDSARAFALLNIAGADAAIACWDAKYFFNFWRPITAIRQADTFPNRGLTADVDWEPLLATLPFPEFPSGHTVISSAIATALAELFGDDPGVPFAAQSPTTPGFVRNWMTFGEGVAEVIEARIYAGLHFRTADEEGAKLGRRVAKFVVRHALPERRHGRH